MQNYKRGNQHRIKRAVSMAFSLQALVKHALKKRGGLPEVEILLNWHAIVGDDLAKVSLPKKICYKKNSNNNRKTGTKGTLHIAVNGAMATEIDHQAALIIEKVNQYMGFEAVTSIRLCHVRQVLSCSVKFHDIATTNIYLEDKDVDLKGLKVALRNVKDEELYHQLQSIGRYLYRKPEDV